MANLDELFETLTNAIASDTPGEEPAEEELIEPSKPDPVLNEPISDCLRYNIIGFHKLIIDLGNKIRDNYPEQKRRIKFLEQSGLENYPEGFQKIGDFRASILYKFAYHFYLVFRDYYNPESKSLDSKIKTSISLGERMKLKPFFGDICNIVEVLEDPSNTLSGVKSIYIYMNLLYQHSSYCVLNSGWTDDDIVKNDINSVADNVKKYAPENSELTSGLIDRISENIHGLNLSSDLKGLTEHNRPDQVFKMMDTVSSNVISQLGSVDKSKLTKEVSGTLTGLFQDEKISRILKKGSGLSKQDILNIMKQVGSEDMDKGELLKYANKLVSKHSKKLSKYGK